MALSAIIGATLPFFSAAGALTYSALNGQLEWNFSELPKLFRAVDFRIRDINLSLIDTILISPLFETMLLAIFHRTLVYSQKLTALKLLSAILIVFLFAIVHGTGPIFYHIFIAFSVFITLIELGVRLHGYLLGSLASFISHSIFNTVLS